MLRLMRVSSTFAPEKLLGQSPSGRRNWMRWQTQ